MNNLNSDLSLVYIPQFILRGGGVFFEGKNRQGFFPLEKGLRTPRPIECTETTFQSSPMGDNDGATYANDMMGYN